MNPLSLDQAGLTNDGGATRAKTIGYWVTTGLLVFCMTGGIFEMLGLKTTVDGIMRLGYPSYIIPALGWGKSWRSSPFCGRGCRG